jgi:hypothetical protein
MQTVTLTEHKRPHVVELPVDSRMIGADHSAPLVRKPSVTLIASPERAALAEQSVRRRFCRWGCGHVERELGGGRRDVCSALDDVRVDYGAVRLQ